MSLLARQNTPKEKFPYLCACLSVLAFLVIFGKYVSPIIYYIAERLAGAQIDDVPVMWDFWWPFYLVVASMIYNKVRRSWLLFLALAATRILWGAVALTLFYVRAEWSFWELQWLFLEILAVGTMVGGTAFALSAVGRDDMLVRSRSTSIAV